ncbi:hypothetical protein BDB01DRAFT_850960 [Pilobolus umbonatus]|nr:hypothetical protein BDB01DRAFT_850960 [Pilobolus umbonatus]
MSTSSKTKSNFSHKIVKKTTPSSNDRHRSLPLRSRIIPSTSQTRRLDNSTIESPSTLPPIDEIIDELETIPTHTVTEIVDTPIEEDYYSHPSLPSFISEIYKRLDSHDILIPRLQAAYEEIENLKDALSVSQLRIAELEAKLNREVSPSDHEMITSNTITQESSTGLLAPLKTYPKGTKDSIHASQDNHPNTPVKSFASIVASNIPKRRTVASKKAIARTFIPISSTHGFQFVYLHSRGKEPISAMRSKLRKLGAHSGRILDIHYPDNNVVGLLIHNDYVTDLTNIFIKFGITPLTDFNPLSHSTIRDPKLGTLSEAERADKATDIHQNRLTHIIQRVTTLPRQLALARAFHTNKWITDSQYEGVLEIIKPNDKRSTLTTSQDIGADTFMSDIADNFRPVSPTSSQAAGENAAPTN